MPTAAPPESKRPKLADPQALLPCAVAQEHAPATADAHASCWANAQVASPALAARSALVPSREGGSETSEVIRARAEAAPRAVRSAENHRQRGPVRLLVGERRRGLTLSRGPRQGVGD